MRISIVVSFFAFAVIDSWWSSLVDAATFPPFVRSRYSLRWRMTTTMPLKSVDGLLTTIAASRDVATSTEAIYSDSVRGEDRTTRKTTTSSSTTTTTPATEAPTSQSTLAKAVAPTTTITTMASKINPTISQVPMSSGAHHNPPYSSSTFVPWKDTTARLPQLAQQTAAAASTTNHPKEKHSHNLAEYDYYDEADIEATDGKQHT